MGCNCNSNTFAAGLPIPTTQVVGGVVIPGQGQAGGIVVPKEGYQKMLQNYNAGITDFLSKKIGPVSVGILLLAGVVVVGFVLYKKKKIKF